MKFKARQSPTCSYTLLHDYAVVNHSTSINNYLLGLVFSHLRGALDWLRLVYLVLPRFWPLCFRERLLLADFPKEPINAFLLLNRDLRCAQLRFLIIVLHALYKPVLAPTTGFPPPSLRLFILHCRSLCSTASSPNKPTHSGNPTVAYTPFTLHQHHRPNSRVQPLPLASSQPHLSSHPTLYPT
ncbi:hypothetical protein BDN72DRAFT_345763 [Pluteus cervinus]|uniref:Uncharacterized protein n=1 Tax=Pluteus cervinus TaxID=181527 RepID=A0ACD3ABE4_9AGAR|nr:hypothetical protein BDN72DRAFT_345763 [Pluteus cervinus]